MGAPSESPREHGRPPWSRFTDRMTGADRERRLIVRIAQLEERLARLEARDGRRASLLGRLDADLRRAERDVEHLRWAATPGLDPVSVPRNGRLVLSGEQPSSKVACSIGWGADADLLSVTGTTHAAYAWRWGWDTVLDGRSGSGEDTTRAKLRLIRELCDDHAWVLWLDPGTSITSTDVDILDGTSHDVDLYVSRSPSHAPIAERALLLARTSDWTRQLLDQLIERPDATLASERYEIVDDAWDWQPGQRITAGPFAMRAPEADPHTRHSSAVERLAVLRTTAAGIPGPFGAAGPLAGFAPSTSAAIPDLLGTLGLTGTTVVAGPAPADFDDAWRAAWDGDRIIRVGGADEADGDDAGIVRWSCDEDEAVDRLEAPVDVVWLLGSSSETEHTRRLMDWWPLVRPGGVMLGFPFADGGGSDVDGAAADAVRWFFTQLGVPLWVTHDADGTATWMAHRPATAEPPSAPPPEDTDA